MFGIDPRYMVLAGGAFIGLLTIFQLLEGKRIIKFKGKLHMRVHRITAWVIVVGAAFHGMLASSLLFGFPFSLS